MIELWATLKVWGEYIIPIIIVVAVLIIGGITLFHSAFTHSRKIKWLRANGFERYLRGVPSVGHGAFYAWRNAQTGKTVDECDLGRMKYGDIKKQMK